MSNRPRIWAVIPAAGRGTRMAASIPKQYLRVAGQTILEHTLNRFRFHPAVHGVVVVIAPQDAYWPRLSLSPAPTLLRVAQGGAERAVSVLNGLNALAEWTVEGDWVVVHDAARPCVSAQDITRLIEVGTASPHGGLLAAPVADTLKRAGTEGRVIATVDRRDLWRALTPQLFPFETLRKALSAAVADGVSVTDEAAAMERLGFTPVLVPGSADNIKLTCEEDLVLVEAILRDKR